MLRCLLVLVLCVTSLPAEWLFTSFRSNGETGVFASRSKDGRVWTPINNNQPWIKPEHANMLMRDPWLGQGPDGVWHLLWTWGWTRGASGPLRIGHTSSRNLKTWTPQQEIPVMESDPTARNAWAPEAAWDPKAKEWVIFWASTITGKFPATDKDGDNGYNHRLYAKRTKDWQTFTPSTLYFDPGFSAIDSSLFRAGKQWMMVFKDERKTPVKKNLRLAFAKSPQGPWKNLSEPFTPAWVEGPTVAKFGSDWVIYFDHYTKPQHVGALSTSDWKTFKEITPDLRFPDDHRHGTIVWVPDALSRQLPQ